ncbi:hypothetical protein J5U23_02924 [Saccharolobus shibatae B12]|uniref:Uncharacterized protein n=1 Tax=Saccharolobus shibatae (strain ATCC 51178 / DSM 5389 / JCM 8931 / NBRC 15437 / B12) TaxID=523848 RepID=A0A8F5BRA8_SACSH|nr:hypothetical protein [Saccharolobus shibatae]QXJ27142.1 hypothetical protein J5U23_p2924 [Saccharolobus shibatae B12]QXJ30035.1 hypothetical protein J5U23_02924 [Saccharolobus shibatae B12]
MKVIKPETDEVLIINNSEELKRRLKMRIVKVNGKICAVMESPEDIDHFVRLLNADEEEFEKVLEEEMRKRERD